MPRFAEFTYPDAIAPTARSAVLRPKNRPAATKPSAQTATVPAANAIIDWFTKEPSRACDTIMNSAAGMATWKTNRPSTASACSPRRPLRPAA